MKVILAGQEAIDPVQVEYAGVGRVVNGAFFGFSVTECIQAELGLSHLIGTDLSSAAWRFRDVAVGIGFRHGGRGGP